MSSSPPSSIQIHIRESRPPAFHYYSRSHYTAFPVCTAFSAEIQQHEAIPNYTLQFRVILFIRVCFMRFRRKDQSSRPYFNGIILSLGGGMIHLLAGSYFPQTFSLRLLRGGVHVRACVRACVCCPKGGDVDFHQFPNYLEFQIWGTSNFLLGCCGRRRRSIYPASCFFLFWFNFLAIVRQEESLYQLRFFVNQDFLGQFMDKIGYAMLGLDTGHSFFSIARGPFEINSDS